MDSNWNSHAFQPTTLEKAMVVSHEVKHIQFFDSPIPLAGVNSKEMKLYSPKNLYTNIHSNFIHNSPEWKKSKCPSIGEWTYKFRYGHAAEHYSAMKRNKLLIYTTTWINCKHITLSERRQTQKSMYNMISCIWSSKLTCVDKNQSSRGLSCRMYERMWGCYLERGTGSSGVLGGHGCSTS